MNTMTRRAALTSVGAAALFGLTAARFLARPGAPTGVNPVAGNGRATVSFTLRPSRERVIEYEVVEVRV